VYLFLFLVDPLPHIPLTRSILYGVIPDPHVIASSLYISFSRLWRFMFVCECDVSFDPFCLTTISIIVQLFVLNFGKSRITTALSLSYCYRASASLLRCGDSRAVMAVVCPVSGRLEGSVTR
jgi:hypothetical protein